MRKLIPWWGRICAKVILSRDTRRIIRPDGICSHQLDLQDHLGGALNNLRIPSRWWEAEWMTRARHAAPPVVWNIRHSLHDIKRERLLTPAMVRAGAVVSRLATHIVYDSARSLRQHRAIGYCSGTARAGQRRVLQEYWIATVNAKAAGLIAEGMKCA